MYLAKDPQTGVQKFLSREAHERTKVVGQQQGLLYINPQKPWPRDTEMEAQLAWLPTDWIEERNGKRQVIASRRERMPRHYVMKPNGSIGADGLDAAFIPVPFMFCLGCGVSHTARQRSDFPKLGTLGSEGRSTATTILTTSAVAGLQREETIKPEARKLLSFTDNRQDASLQTEWRQQPAALTQAFPTPRHAVDYILDTFPIVKRKDEAKFNGDYRTKRVILEIYDALTESMQTGKAYQTRLDPPPADARCCHPPRQVSIPAPTWMDRALVLPTSRRVVLTPDRYRATVVPHLLYQAGGSISFDRFRKAYWLLTEPKTLERYASGAVGDIARGWGRTFRDTLEKDRFIEHLKGAVGRQLHFVPKGGERWLELRDPKVADDEHVIFDARLALLVADLWPMAEPIMPLAPAEEITIQELEAVL